MKNIGTPQLFYFYTETGAVMFASSHFAESQVIHAVCISKQDLPQGVRLNLYDGPFGKQLEPEIDTGDGYHFVLFPTVSEDNKHYYKIYCRRVHNELLFIEGKLNKAENKLTTALAEIEKLSNTASLFGIVDKQEFIGYIPKVRESACYTIRKSQSTIRLDPSIKRLYAGSFLCLEGTNNTHDLTILQKEELDYISTYFLYSSNYRQRGSLTLTWESRYFSEHILGALGHYLALGYTVNIILTLDEFYNRRQWLLDYYNDKVVAEAYSYHAKKLQAARNIHLICDNYLIRAKHLVDYIHKQRYMNSRVISLDTLKSIAFEALEMGSKSTCRTYTQKQSDTVLEL